MTTCPSPAVAGHAPPDERELRNAADVSRCLAESMPWSAGTAAPVGARLGLECEWFAVSVDESGQVRGRVPLLESSTMLDAALEESLRGAQGPGVPAGGRITFEPGGQIEFSSGIHGSVQELVAQVVSAREWIQQVLGPSRRLVAVGVDPWHPVSAVPQQLPDSRYQAMSAYFASRGGERGPGAVMMRNTCSVQLNIDADPADPLGTWWAATLVAPILGRAFDTAPRGRTSRAQVWEDLDHTRVGSVLTGPADTARTPLELVTRSALRADVMMVRRPDGHFRSTPPGLGFGNWVDDPSVVGRRPTVADLRHHLTTVWTHVRTRTFLELRTVDSLPLCRLAPLVTIASGLMLDARAREAVIAEMLPVDAPSWARWCRAIAGDGVQTLVLRTLLLGLEGAERLASPLVTTHDLEAAADFVECFTGPRHRWLSLDRR